MTLHIPEPVDVHVGQRVRARRKSLGMSQTKLAEACGLTFQQVQKYERGTNRIACSRLVQIAEALDVTPASLLDGMGSQSAERLSPFAHSYELTYLARELDAVSEPARKELLKLFGRMVRLCAEVEARERAALARELVRGCAERSAGAELAL